MTTFRTITTLLILTLLLSCAGYREKRTDRLFEQWRLEVEAIRKTTVITDESTRQLIDLELCSTDQTQVDLVKRDFPKLAYEIFQEFVEIHTVSVMPEYKGDLFDYDFNPKYKGDTVTYRYLPACPQGALLPLVELKKYRKQTSGELKYGFGSISEGRNRGNARAVLESHHSVVNYVIPKRIEKIIRSEDEKAALVFISTTYRFMVKRYLKTAGVWEFDEVLYSTIE